ncbi:MULTISPECIES: ABC transporter permease [unclassified Chelatococcus]|uniref:ABC transporter permease n=1 Tax=unclassified Chelatococcus TaxID=2638111 RepID=UPI001BCFE24D|nr:MULTISPECIES: ABC transporter permease [unclassified Chelatococcus]MBS7699856.1 ABC transporter permease [Chelatococcus sp. YT9]MBX3558798.1 ABC transporter permease [Chelatococcus sp.]
MADVTASTAPAPTGVARRLGANVTALFFTAPIILLLIVFFAVPLFDLFGFSFTAYKAGPRTSDGPMTLVNFTAIFGDPFYLAMIGNSLMLGLLTVIATLLIGYPVAFYLTRASGWERTLISVACLLPIFVNLIVGILGWYILLLPFGVFQQILSSVGLVDGPLPWLRSFWTLVAVLTYEHLPFAILILASTIQAVPQDKINAARILGASTPRIIWNLMLPLTAPGLVASAILVFSLSVSSYLIPILISGPRTQVLPIAIFSYASELMNWPMASALALVLLIVVATMTYAAAAVANRVTRRGQWEMV